VLSIDHSSTDPKMPLRDALYHGVWSSALLAVKFMMRVGICLLPQKCLEKHPWEMTAFGSWAGCQCQTYSLISRRAPVRPRPKVPGVVPLSAPGSPRSSDRNAKRGHGTPKATQCANRKSLKKYGFPALLPRCMRPVMMLKLIFWFSQRVTHEQLVSYSGVKGDSARKSIVEIRRALEAQIIEESNAELLGDQPNTVVLIDETHIC
jgi:hypothetical protein